MPTKNELDFNQYHGLSDNQAKESLEKFGYNELPETESNGLLSIIKSIITEPMISLLIACGVIYFFLGDLKEAFVLLGCILIIVAITVFQEAKTEKALKALRDLSSPRALVIRGGERKRIAGREVTAGDILILNEGDRIPADAIILAGMNLMVDESILTGESAPVRKSHSSLEEVQADIRPGGDDSPMVYSGTVAVKGMAAAQVIKTGINTEIGKIGKALNIIEPETTRLQLEIKKIVIRIAVVGVFLCAIVTVVYALTRHDWLNGFLGGLALAMGILPEEFPLILTIFLALGAWRISKSQVLARKLPAIENLGSATVLCVDKTGTLTHNRMAIKKLWIQNAGLFSVSGKALPAPCCELAEQAILTTRQDALESMEVAIQDMDKKFRLDSFGKYPGWKLINEYSLSKKLLAITQVWQSPDNRSLAAAAKGAPEAIVDLCHLKEADRKKIMDQVDIMSLDGLRVIGIAKAIMPAGGLPADQHDLDFEFVGLIGFADLIRKTVNQALKDCYSAGIRVIMITGDYLGTAKNIAKTIGLRNFENGMTGQTLSDCPPDELKKEINNISIFARVMPEQKMQIIKALKANNEVAAMTGDGVNDAPALRAADIGIAMGEKGTDVAREAADLVLLDDDFSSIVKAVKIGRTIFDNLKKAIAYLVSIHIPIAGLALIPVFMKWPLILFPVHIVFMELVVDPACSLVFESSPAEDDVMKRPPKKLNAPLFSRQSIIFSLIQGVIVLAGISAIAFGLHHYDYSEFDIRAIAFAALVFANMALIFVNFSWGKTLIKNLTGTNRVFWAIEIFTFSFLMACLYIPGLQNMFKFSQLHYNDLIIAVLPAVAVVLAGEIIKVGKIKIGRELVKEQ